MNIGRAGRVVSRGLVRTRWGKRFEASGREENKGGNKGEGSGALFIWMVVPLGVLGWQLMDDMKTLYHTFTAPYRAADVAGDISMVISRYGCGPIFLRLAWQSACLYDKKQNTGQLNGCLAEPSCIYAKLPCSNGLDRGIQLLKLVKDKYPAITWPDLIAFAGCVAVEEMGGPRITFRYGRKEKELDIELQELLAKIPDQNKSIGHVKNVFYKMGLSRSELVALMGGHTVGGTHKQFTGVEGNWTTTPFVFNNAYFLELLDGDWKATSRAGEASCFTSSDLTMFPADLALLKDPELKKYVELFAENELVFHEVFASSFEKLMELGYTDLRNSGAVCSVPSDAQCRNRGSVTFARCTWVCNKNGEKSKQPTDNACCLEAEARAAFSSPYVPFNATEKCSQVVRQTLCHVCSPVQSSFFSSGRVRLCLSQCIVMYKWCGNAMLAEPNDPVHANDIAAYTRPIREAFTDGTAFCNWLGYNVTADPSNAIQPSCYRQLESLSV